VDLGIVAELAVIGDPQIVMSASRPFAKAAAAWGFESGGDFSLSTRRRICPKLN